MSLWTKGTEDKNAPQADVPPVEKSDDFVDDEEVADGADDGKSKKLAVAVDGSVTATRVVKQYPIRETSIPLPAFLNVCGGDGSGE